MSSSDHVSCLIALYLLGAVREVYRFALSPSLLTSCARLGSLLVASHDATDATSVMATATIAATISLSREVHTASLLTADCPTY